MEREEFSVRSEALKARLYRTACLYLRIDLEDDERNTVWLKGLDLYLENKYGQRFECGSGSGIRALGDSNGDGMASFWLDSPFFSQSEHLTLYITQVQWQDKDAPWVRLDLAGRSAEHLPDGVRLVKAECRNGSWDLEFAVSRKLGTPCNYLSAGGFWDESGNKTDITEYSVTTGYHDPGTGDYMEDESVFTEMFTMKGLDGDVAYLKPGFNRTTIFTIPAAIPIK